MVLLQATQTHAVLPLEYVRFFIVAEAFAAPNGRVPQGPPFVLKSLTGPASSQPLEHRTRLSIL